MRILFVHQNFPGQFLHLAPELQRRGHEVTALTDAGNRRPSGIRTWHYRHDVPRADPVACRLGRTYTDMTDRGVSIARAARTLRDDHGYVPDVIFGHPGWGETLFLKEVWPEAKLILYAEFFYRATGADAGFDAEFTQSGLDQQMITHARAGHLGLAMLSADAALAPTRWQASSFPAQLQPIIEVIFDGIDTRRLVPDPAASFTLPEGPTIRAGDEVLTFINRNLEPYRGYHVFMRALPEIMAARPELEVVIIGGDGISYGAPSPDGRSWREVFLSEVEDRLDMNRVHFLGKVPHADFVRLMQISRVHAYLTYPFVLSWSTLEAMAAGACVVASRTAPVTEVIEDGVNGHLVDFHDVPGLARKVVECLAHPEAQHSIRHEARRRVLEGGYDLQGDCLPRAVDFVEAVWRGHWRPDPSRVLRAMKPVAGGPVPGTGMTWLRQS